MIGQKPFITKWKTDNPGTSDSESITIPTVGSGYNYDVDWNNDGIFEQTGITGDVTHKFDSAGVYIIRIRGDFPRIYFCYNGDREKILDIMQWGDISWSSMGCAFQGCKNLISSATDAPDLSNVTSLRAMFSYASLFNSNINSWDVSNITDMQEMFHYAESFDQPLNNWDVSNVKNMEGMFHFATSFNQNINNWKVHNVTNMQDMFSGESVNEDKDMAFNKPLNNWDVHNATNMKKMFAKAVLFDQDINSWKVDSVKTINGMFLGASSFNHPLDSWNVGNVTDMGHVFYEASSFNQDISMWDVSKVEKMFGMFAFAGKFNQPLNSWKVDSVKNIALMFAKATSFNQPLNSWKVGNVEKMHAIFFGASSFNQSLSSWNIEKVTSLSDVFNDATSFNQSLATWNISSVTNMFTMLDNSGIDVDNYDKTLNAWANQSVQQDVELGAKYLKYCKSDSSRHFLINDKGWVISGDTKDCSQYDFVTTWKTDYPGISSDSSIIIPTFPGETYDYEVDWNNDGVFDSTGITGDFMHKFDEIGIYTIRIRGVFPRIYFNNTKDAKKILDIKQWGSNPWKSMEDAFSGCDNFNISAKDTPNLSKVKNMSSMFSRASKFNSPIDSWDVSNVEDMNGLFETTDSFNQSINSWDVSKVINMDGMFAGAMSYNQPLDSLDVSNVHTMAALFYFAKSFNQALNSWDVSNVIDMGSMFEGASSFNQPLGKWDVHNVADMAGMFAGAEHFNQPLDTWKVSNVTKMQGIFSNAILFNQNLGKWDISKIADLSGTLSNSGLDVSNYDNTLNGWASQTVQNGVKLDAVGLKYCDGETARNTLKAKGWIFTGDAKDCNDAFVTIWKTDNIGVSNPDVIRIFYDDTMSYNYDVDWDNDGIYEQTGITGPVSHQFSSPGIYKIRIKGTFPRFLLDGDGPKLISVNQWGSIKWECMENAFGGCSNLTLSASDTPDLTKVKNLSMMFSDATAFNQDINDWDVSKVTNMSGMFLNADSFNQSINSWNTSKVTNMSFMFGYASSFNKPLDSLDVSNVTDMSGMLYAATLFNQSLNSWDVSNVKDMSSLFAHALSYNKPMDSWDVSNVKSMAHLFFGAAAFNQNINSWDVSNVEDMSEMFYYANTFDHPLDSLDVSNVKKISGIFSHAKSFNQSLDSWDVSNVIDMSNMFSSAESFNQSLENWDISSVESMTSMLSNTIINADNYDNTLIAWSKRNVKQNVKLGADNLKYCAGKSARDTLISKGWVISGDMEDCTLPIEIISIDAHVINNKMVEIQWKTSSEINNKGFEILRSKNGINWETIGFVSGANLDSNINDYHYIDEKPYPGQSFYRLLQIDFDGNTALSNIVTINIEDENILLEVYPNPSNGAITIHINNPNKQKGNLRIIDNLGKVIFKDKISDYDSNIEKKSYIQHNGIYYITIQIGNHITNKKIIITEK